MGEVPRDSSSSTPNSTTISHEKELDVESSRSVCVSVRLSQSSLTLFILLGFVSFVLWIDLSERCLACIFWHPSLLGFLARRSETHLYQIKPFACVGEWPLRCDTLQCFCNFLVCINYSELQFQNYQITWKQKRFGRWKGNWKWPLMILKKM